MRGVTLITEYFNENKEISTHTPHARRDDEIEAKVSAEGIISTHTPHARRDVRCLMRSAR